MLLPGSFYKHITIHTLILEVSLKIVETIKIVTFPSDLTQIDSVVVEDFDAVRSVVGDEDLLTVVDHHTVREFKVFRAAKFVKDIAHLKKSRKNN